MRGGKREGSGRPKGARTVRTTKVAEREHQNGITPLEVMLKAMRAHVAKDDLDAAASIAKDAAPYMHAKLASVQHQGKVTTQGISIDADKLKDMSDDELAALESAIGKLQSGFGAGEGGEDET